MCARFYVIILTVPVETDMRYLLLFSWFFFLVNATGDPVYWLHDFLTQGDCTTARTWAIQAHFKTTTPDPVLAAQYASPCFQEYVLQQ